MKYLDRYNREFDAVVCLNTSLPGESFFNSIKSNKIIATDGAVTRLMENGIRPDIIIGDFDSLDISSLADDFNKNSLIFDPTQDTNDFEKALSYCLDKGYNKLLILGIHGGELEHTVNNLSVLKKYSDNLDICFYDNHRRGILISRNINMQTYPGEIISLIPFPYARLTTKNLEWELNNEILELGNREGARNKSVSTTIEIRINNGNLILFFDDNFEK